MKYTYNISEQWRKELLTKERRSMYKVRQEIIDKFGIDKANDLWYTKTEYIDTWDFPENYLFMICEDCGRPSQLMDCTFDKPASNESRNVGFKCKCGRYHVVNC